MYDQMKLGLGTAFNSGKSDLSPDQYVDNIVQALELGYRHLDTAQVYDSERFVGKAIEQASVPRDDLVIATKLHSDELRYDRVIEATHEQIEVLRLDYIDLLYVHYPAPPYEAEETLAAFEELQDAGLIKHVGVSNFTIDLLEEARDYVSILAHQTELHPLWYDEELIEYAQRHDMWLVAHTPLARGEVTTIPTIQQIAEKHDSTTTQITLAWLLEKEQVAAIPSCRGDHIRENYEAQSIDLSDEDVRRIESIEREKRFVDFDIAPWNW